MKFIPILVLLFLVSCAAGPKKFVAPSTSAVHANINQTSSHIDSAGKDAKAAKDAIVRAAVLAKGQDALLAQLSLAGDRIDSLTASLLAAKASNANAETKLATSDKEMVMIVDKANKISADNDKAQAIVKRVQGWWGIGGILYGFERLAAHLLILIVVLAVVAIALVVASLFFPALAPVLGFAVSIWNRFLGLFKKK